MKLTFKIISAVGQATVPSLHLEIVGAVGLMGMLVQHFAMRSFCKTISVRADPQEEEEAPDNF